MSRRRILCLLGSACILIPLVVGGLRYWRDTGGLDRSYLLADIRRAVASEIITLRTSAVDADHARQLLSARLDNAFAVIGVQYGLLPQRLRQLVHLDLDALTTLVVDPDSVARLQASRQSVITVFPGEDVSPELLASLAERAGGGDPAATVDPHGPRVIPVGTHAETRSTPKAP